MRCPSFRDNGLAVLALLLTGVQSLGRAQTVTVRTEEDLRAAISDPSTQVILLGANITLNHRLPPQQVSRDILISAPWNISGAPLPDPGTVSAERLAAAAPG